jgi:hypothetical protein
VVLEPHAVVLEPHGAVLEPHGVVLFRRTGVSALVTFVLRSAIMFDKRIVARV